METLLALVPTVLLSAAYLLHQYRTRALEGPAEHAEATPPQHPQPHDESLKAA
jgi:hypothetical protein